MIRRRHLIVVVGALLIGCAVLLVVGCAGVPSQAPQKGQGHTEATKEQARSPEATTEEARCAGTRTWRTRGALVTTNDVSGCPNGGLLSGTDKPDNLNGKMGEDEIRGLGAADIIFGGAGNDVMYGGPGDDTLLVGGEGDDVIYAGDGDDGETNAGNGEDVVYGGDGNDHFLDVSWDRQRDRLYCGAGRDNYLADKIDYVSSSCEVKMKVGRGVP